MCRYDDDYAWMVDSTDHAATSDEDRLCEDCYRTIAAGEAHTEFTAYETDEGYDYVFAAQHSALAGHATGPGQRLYIRESEHHVVIDEDDSGIWEALGFVVDEIEAEKHVEYHYSCAHCIIANRWLEKICGQHTVMVTVEDLHTHVDEYDPETLGPAFMAMHRYSRRKWHFVQAPDNLLDPEVLAVWVDRAIDHAIAKGLQEAH